jgi:hypothetical protein
VRPLDIVRKVVEVTSSLRKRRQEEGGSAVSLDAALRVLEATTAVARKARAGPLPPASGLERLALTAAQAQLRVMASMLGIPVGAPAEPPPADASPDEKRIEGFVSPGDRALMREEKEAQIRAALGALVAEALALVDAVLMAAPEIGSVTSRGAMGEGQRRR